MFFNDIIQRTLASLLRPWLRQEPEMEVTLGFLRSHAVAKNLYFNTHALSQLLGESNRLSIKDVKVERLSVQISNWSFPAFTIEVHGVHVTLAVGESTRDGCLKEVKKSAESSSQDMKNILSVIDPEGCYLNDTLERISAIPISRNRLTNSVLNLLVGHCHLKVRDINLQVQFIISDEFFGCLFGLKELNAEPQQLHRGCLLIGLVGALFVPRRDSSFSLNGRDLEVQLKKKDHVTCIIPSFDLFTHVNLKDFQHIDFNTWVPELCFSFCPPDMYVISALVLSLSEEYSRPRSGKQLWKIAASKISHLTSGPSLLLHKLVGFLVLWIHYVKAYEHLLFLVGYPSDDLLKRSVVKMSHDRSYSKSVREQWKVVYELARELPVEAIGRAWRVARYRAAMNLQDNNDGYTKLQVNDGLNYVQNINLLIVYAWKLLCCIFSLFACLFYLRRDSTRNLNFDKQLRVVSEDSNLKLSTSLNIGNVAIMLSAIDSAQPTVVGKLESSIGISYSDLLSFSLRIDGLVFMYREYISEQFFTFSCGNLEVLSSSLMGTARTESSSKNYNNSLKGHPNERFNDTKTIFWGEPTEIFHLFEDKRTTENQCTPFLENLLREMWLSWKRSCTEKFEETQIKCLPNPCLLFEYRSFLIDPGLKTPNSGFRKCCLAVGKLNFTLDYTSILSLAFYFKKLQYAVSYSPKPTVNPSEVNNVSMCTSHASRIKTEMLQILPQKHIQFGVLIAGARICISLRRKGYFGRNTYASRDFQLAFDAHNIELAIWPTERQGKEGAVTELKVRVKEPQIIDNIKVNNEDYVSKEQILLSSYIRVNGLNVYLEDLVESQQYHIMVLKLITAQSASLRENLYSFSTTDVALSSALFAISTGVTISLFMDELSVLSQMVVDLLSGVSYTYSRVDSTCSNDFPTVWKQEKKEALWGASKSGSIVSDGTLLKINCDSKIEMVDIILDSSRKDKNSEAYIKAFGSLNNKKSSRHGENEHGFWISAQNVCTEVSYEEEGLIIFSNFSGIRSFIFKYVGISTNQYGIDNKLLLESDLLYEISLSNSTFNSSMRSSVIEGSSHWLLIKISISEILLSECSVKNVLVGIHEPKKLLLSVSVGGDFRTILCGIEGGFVLLEATALVMFARCFYSFVHSITNLTTSIPSFDQYTEIARPSEVVTEPSDNDVNDAQGTTNAFQKVKWENLTTFNLDLSQFTVVLASANESGVIREFVFEAEIHLKYKLENRRRKCLFDLSRLSTFSHILQTNLETKLNQIQVPQVSSVISKDLSGDPITISPLDDASCSYPPVTVEDSQADNNVSHTFISSDRNSILKHLGAFISVEKPETRDEGSSLSLDQFWSGNGSISGVDMTISLAEVQIVMSIIVSLSAALRKETTDDIKRNLISSNRESPKSFEELVPDGAVVAIQDAHQHEYFTVVGLENKYSLAGSVHYSLVGERALFRVKYHNQRRWKSPISWFSLISLHAKSDLGEPLRLNYNPIVGFVDISATDDSSPALWKAISYKPENYEMDFDLDPLNQLNRNSFHLVNKKNDSGVAFVDGFPEFVRKPGNQFKLKVFHDYSLEASRSKLQQIAGLDKERNLGGTFPCIELKIDKVTLTVVDEISNTKDRFPLLQGCISNIQFIIHVLSYKARIMSTLEAMMHYFDASRNLWRELVYPVKICIFYSSRFQGSTTGFVSDKVPTRCYLRTKQCDIFLTEVSLDILLFMIGNLNLAGPFSVRSSLFLANCCKVENQLGLNLNYRFNDSQDAIIAKGQSVFIYVRHSPLADQSSGNQLSVSIKVGALSTSPIPLSLVEARSLAWRTCIISEQDSRTYPGPFVVADIARKVEDGLVVVVSPLLRIHNKTEFPLELRFQESQEKESEFVSVLLKAGDTIDDSMAMFGDIHVSGGSKKALMSLTAGNFLFSFRPEIKDHMRDLKTFRVDWSDDLEGGKAFRLSGIFDKLSYRVRKALSVESMKCSFATAHCSLQSDGQLMGQLHFLIQSITRYVPVVQPDNFEHTPEIRSSPVALQEQKQIFLLPTVRISNLLHSEIHVLLSEIDLSDTTGCDSIGKQASIPSGSTVELYANPAVLYFTVTLAELNSSCKPVNSGDWVNTLLKKKNDVHYLDVNLDFDGGRYVASLRLSCGTSGILEAVVFTFYALKNDTDLFLFCYAPNQKPIARDEVDELGSNIPPNIGSLLPPKSTKSWFMKSNKLWLTLLEGKASQEQLNLDAISGFTQISFEVDEGSEFKKIATLGVSLGPYAPNIVVPSQIVSLVPRYVVFNESDEDIILRQCYVEDDIGGMMTIARRQKNSLLLQKGMSKRGETTLFENFIRKHRNTYDNSSIFIQFRLKESGLGWSGPICIASIGRFFLKFRKLFKEEPTIVEEEENYVTEFAAVNIVEEGSTLVLHFYKPPNVSLPYRIENRLDDSSITYYQKDSLEQEILGAGSNADYVWNDLTLPHKLIVYVTDMNLLREINFDKVRRWKPFFKDRKYRGLGLHLPLSRKTENERQERKDLGIISNGLDMLQVGFEVYADGPTRVLRICKPTDSKKGDKGSQSCAKIQSRISSFNIHLLEQGKREVGVRGPSVYTPIIVARVRNINLDSVFTDQQKYVQIGVQAVNVDHKWVGAPFAAMLRQHQLDYRDANDCVLRIVFVLLSNTSDVIQVDYASIVLQPVDLNLDEETMMKLVPFWRTSLNESTQSRQFYFDHFEIHPVKIVVSFLPGVSYSSYSSAQEALRSLLHSVIKIPTVKNKVVELNGVLVTHALITIRELFIKCAQHYSWYAMRAIYIAKGSPLLPPAFASIFDDLASSSLDVFFDPSTGLINLPGLTLGTFKLISKCINGKGFSGTKRYFGDLGKTLRTAGSNVLYAAVTEISDSVLKGAEASGFKGLVSGFHQGILNLAMEPSLLGSAFIEGGPNRKIKLDRSPGIDELYVEGYLQAMLDTIYKQEYLRVRVIDDQVILKNLPPSSSLIEEIMDRVKGFLVNKALLKGDSVTTSRPFRHLRGESEWKIGPTVLTLCEHLFVSFAIRILRKRSCKIIGSIKWKKKLEVEDEKAIEPSSTNEEGKKFKFKWKWGIGKFVLSSIVAYVDGRLCRSIPNPLVRRIVSGFLLSFFETDDTE